MKKGILYWITGLSGAGKTTIGSSLYYELLEKKDNVVLLDGDILKKIVGSDLGYSYAERFERAKRYSNLCKMLVDQGMVVIICTIAMFDEIREWNRQNINGYVEIFLDVDMDVLRKRNQKGLYSKQQLGGVMNLAGVDMETQLPQNPDIVINNDGSIPVAQCVKTIMDYNVRYELSECRDSMYWNEFYRKHKEFSPSLFAQSLVDKLEEGKYLLELGCGNGRDSLFFANNGVYVTAIDASEPAISYLKDSKAHENMLFICDDFVKSEPIYQRQYDYIYSRFTLHAISEREEHRLLNNVTKALKANGKLFIEARSIHDEIFGMGQMVEKNAYIYNDHFRRFIDMDELKSKLVERGFSILYAEESDEFSPTEDSKPMLIRMIATK